MANPISELFHRRVPQIVGLYLVGCWGFVEFTDWAVEQYVLSPHVTNFVVIALISLLPSVILLAWRFGAPGDDTWTRTESIVVPLNVIASAAILFFTFTGKDLGAATTTVVVEDEAGNEVQRQVPKQEFRKRVALFAFDNAAGDTALDWLSYGVPLAVLLDLSQQLFVLPSSLWDQPGPGQAGMLHELREAGFDDGVGVPLTLKRDIAERRHIEYFLAGSAATDSTGYVLEYQLYETRRAKLLARQSFTGSDIFVLIDQMSEQLRRDLNVPAYRIEESVDLPVSELMTTSVPAFRDMALGVHTFAKGDFPGAIPLLQRAAEEDPTFAFARAQLSGLLLLSNRPEEAAAAMNAAMQHLYRLPERLQLAFRAGKQMIVDQDAEKAFNTARYWGELYPDDIAAHQLLAQMYGNRGDQDNAIAELEVILELDPTQYDNLRAIGSLYSSQGEYQRALEYFQRYADRFPDDYRSYTSLAGVHRRMGAHDEARAAYERAAVVEPDEGSVLLGLARLEVRLGNFERASELRDQALEVARSPQDRYSVYRLDETLHYWQGQYRALEVDYRRRSEVAEEYMNAASQLLTRATASFLVNSPEVGREADALQELDRLAAQATPPFGDLLTIAYLQIYQALDDAERTREQIDRLNEVIEALGFEVFRPFVHFALGRVAEIEGDCEEASAHYGKSLEMNPDDSDVQIALARCQLKLGDSQAALATLEEVLRVIPAHPHALYQLALVYEAMGRTDDAITQLEAALEIWKNADPEFIPAQRARAKLAELQTAA